MLSLLTFRVRSSSLLATRTRTPCSPNPYFRGVPLIAAHNVVPRRQFGASKISFTCMTVDPRLFFDKLLEELARGRKETIAMSERISEVKYKMLKEAIEEKEKMVRSFDKERVKLNKLLDDQRVVRMKAENNLLHLQGRLNCRGMLEYIAAEKYPYFYSTAERLDKCVEQKTFVDVLHHVCGHRHARSDDVINSLRHIYHTLSEHFQEGNDDTNAVTIRECYYASADVTALVTFFEWADKDYMYEDRDNQLVHRYHCKWYKPLSP
ncbi:hypothetical protein BKA69DRAFT_1120758 [Paraphysoderma sedebokerense]|nr:hypothetical protein BKA69DRAFT_1120758 [Paraphysoderma sedebokerense]